MTPTLENHESRIRAIEAKLGIGTRLKLGYVASANEIGLVKQIGATMARIQGWPGGAQSIVNDGAFNHGLDVSIRIAREYIPNTTSKALEPLTTDALRREMTLAITADLAIYKANGVKTAILGNEPEGTKKNADGVSVPRYWTGKIDRFGTDWAQYIAPLVRAAGMRVGYGLPIFPSNTLKFANDLIASGAYKTGDFFAANVYGGNAEAHHRTKDEHIAALRQLPTFNPDTDYEISEAGLKRGGGQDAWVADFARAIELYRSTNFPGAVYIYRIVKNGEAPFAPFEKTDDPNNPFATTPTFDRWKAMDK